MYADAVTPSMEAAIRETLRRRRINRWRYNEEHGITPQHHCRKTWPRVLEISSHKEDGTRRKKKEKNAACRRHRAHARLIEQLTKEMKAAAKLLEFEHAAYLRDKIKSLQEGK